jgi:hypothetical protein
MMKKEVEGLVLLSPLKAKRVRKNHNARAYMEL